ECFAPTGRGPMKTQGFEARFSQNLAPVSPEKPQNPYLAYISHLFSKPQLNSSKIGRVYLNLPDSFSVISYQ
ncbi:MAG: hypothetical protein ACKPH1_18935, partial [Microcystis panniformis]|uniref:hypothetical protein n=1 Tax=Microcystis sp. LE19-84.1B TaxID=3016438 RepID=UPI0022BF122E